MTLWIVGAGGMLGRDLARRARAKGIDVRPLTRAELDLTDPGPWAGLGLQAGDALVNCAAYTAVDDAESHAAEADAVNHQGAGRLAELTSQAGVRMVQISTDYVFAGTASTPYAEDAPTVPATAYGRTKAAGEHAVRQANPESLIVRTAWLYGAHGPCFPKTMLRLAATNPTLSVVADQFGQPTWTRDVADDVLRLIGGDAPAGTYHATSGGATSWFEFAQEVLRTAGADPGRVQAVSSAEFVRPAPRPAYSVLGHDAWALAGIEPIADWRKRWRAASAEVTSGS